MRSSIVAGTALVWLIAGACDHTAPVPDPPSTADRPFAAGEPVQLTLNEGPDRSPAWLPDGSSIVYSAQQLGRTDNDVCLALLPATGGTQRSLTCDLTPNGADSTNALESAAVGGDRIAYRLASSAPGALDPNTQTLVVAPLADPRRPEPLLRIPYTIPGQTSHGTIGGLRWLGNDRLTWIGEIVTYRPPCDTCPPDTLAIGLDIVTMETSGAASPRHVPGTERATSVAPVGSDSIVYTVAGDSRIFRASLDGGASVLYDFGAQGIARDVDMVGSRLTAVVGGRIGVTADPQFGLTQWDSGGAVHVVDLVGGTDTPLPTARLLFRHPALSPSGEEIVVEGHPLLITATGGSAADTTVDKTGDLYLLGGR